MKQITYSKGKYSQFQLENGLKFLLEALPQVLTIRKIILLCVPTKVFWSYKLPFYIRTATEALDTSVELIDIILNELANIQDSSEFQKYLNPKIEAYIRTNKERAEAIAISKVGHLALKAKK